MSNNPFEELSKRAKEAKKSNLILRKIFEQDLVRLAMIKLNQAQLQEGQEADGKIIRTYGATGTNVYSLTAIHERQERGLVTDKVTLQFTGAFYKTFRVKTTTKDVSIVANFKKGSSSISDNVDTSNVLGLNDKNEQYLIENIVSKLYVKEVCEILINGKAA